MSEAISVIMPAYKAEQTIVRAVNSVVTQSSDDWELIIVADDGLDYEQILGRAGVTDKRLRFLSTGAVGSGSPPARNIGLDAAQNRFVTGLDADDLLHHSKLAVVSEALENHGVVSTALQVVSAELVPLRTVGAGPDKVLSTGDYKFTNISMDSMVAHDRQKGDPRFNADFRHLSDVEFLLRLFATNDNCFHIGVPLHTYVKQPQSISNTPGASAALITTKIHLLKALAEGKYPLADSNGIAGLLRFYEASLLAEKAYETRLTTQPGLLFEDHLEPFLSAASTSAR